MSFDFAIIGAGIAGASLAAELAPYGRTILLEAEDAPGYHATGRSAAFWSETYGGPRIQPLTTASHDFLAYPPAEFADRPFLDQYGALHIADADGQSALAVFVAEFADSDVVLDELEATEIARHIPGIAPGWTKGVFEPSCADIDVAALHQAYLRGAKRAGSQLCCNARVEALAHEGENWAIGWRGHAIEAEVVINAAGAWADDIAAMAGIQPLGITAYRRTMVQLRTDPAPPEKLPLVIDALGRFYFKSEAGGRLWLSPHDEIAVEPGDSAPEEMDIAIAIARFKSAVDWKVEAVERKWAGLRSFAPDRLPVYGFDPLARNFFWCAGQGGFGIQTAPAAATLARALITAEPAASMVAAIDPRIYAPDRLR